MQLSLFLYAETHIHPCTCSYVHTHGNTYIHVGICCVHAGTYRCMQQVRSGSRSPTREAQRSAAVVLPPDRAGALQESAALFCPSQALSHGPAPAQPYRACVASSRLLGSPLTNGELPFRTPRMRSPPFLFRQHMRAAPPSPLACCPPARPPACRECAARRPRAGAGRAGPPALWRRHGGGGGLPAGGADGALPGVPVRAARRAAAGWRPPKPGGGAGLWGGGGAVGEPLRGKGLKGRGYGAWCRRRAGGLHGGGSWWSRGQATAAGGV